MKLLLRDGLVYHNHRFETLDVLAEDGRIAGMGHKGADLMGVLRDDL